MEQQERRRHPRYRIDRPVYLGNGHGDAIRVRACDISLSGLGLLSPEIFEEGEILGLRLQLGFAGFLEEAKLRGRVCYTHLKDSAYAIGIEFVEMEADLINKLRHFLGIREKLRQLSS
jgi:hypothetical protein